MALKLLYIDAVYPLEWLQQKQAELNLADMPFMQYREWLIDQRIYLSDYIPRNLEQHGFTSEILVVNDPLFISKFGKHIQRYKVNRNTAGSIKKLAHTSIHSVYRWLKPNFYQQTEAVVRKAINWYRPDVIFVREPSGIDTYFWNQFRKQSVVAALIGCNTAHPYRWLSHNFDVLFSITEEYYQFFKVQGLPSYFFAYGVDEMVYQQLQTIQNKVHDVVFVGALGNEVQTAKTKLMEAVASKFNFKWWGPRNVDANSFPNLYKCYQGKTSGIAMLQEYRQSKIVLNDYVDTANGNAVNLRLYEVLNTGSFLLTRQANNLTHVFPAGMPEMYSTAEECFEKLEYFLANDAEREQKAQAATEWALENVSYKRRLEIVGAALKTAYDSRNRTQQYAAIG